MSGVTPVLHSLGWTEALGRHLAALGDPALRPARVSAVERGGFSVSGLEARSAAAASSAGQPGRAPAMRRGSSAGHGLEAPTVGDWVACREVDGALLIDTVLPRTSCFVRKAAGRESVAQLIAANVDLVLVVTAVGEDFNPRRLERYLTAIWASGAQPAIVVNKSDRPFDRGQLEAELAVVAPDLPVAVTSATQAGGLDELDALLEPGRTVAFVGSSGVGKSTLINRLLGVERLATGSVREDDDKGRHTTSRRQLIVSPGGVVLIDTPGMRELGLWDARDGLSVVFADLVELAERCRFRDCEHGTEPSCSVREAVEAGLLPPERLASFRRLAAELAATEARAERRAPVDSKKRWKSISKAVRGRRKLNRRLGLKED